MNSVGEAAGRYRSYCVHCQHAIWGERIWGERIWGKRIWGKRIWGKRIWGKRGAGASWRPDGAAVEVVLIERRAVTEQRLAAVAQLVERVLGKDEVTGPTPVSSSTGIVPVREFVAALPSFGNSAAQSWPCVPAKAQARPDSEGQATEDGSAQGWRTGPNKTRTSHWYIV